MSSSLNARQIQQAQLPNGLRIVTEYMPHVRSVSMGVWVASGSRREIGDQNGIAHFIEWLGHVDGDAKAKAFVAADVFVLPSHSENFGIVVAEAIETLDVDLQPFAANATMQFRNG